MSPRTLHMSFVHLFQQFLHPVLLPTDGKQMQVRAAPHFRQQFLLDAWKIFCAKDNLLQAGDDNLSSFLQ